MKKEVVIEYDFLALHIDGVGDYVYHITAIDDIACQRVRDDVLEPLTAGAFYGGMALGRDHDEVAENVSYYLTDPFEFEFFDEEYEAADWLAAL